jgi:hypothetical protein
LVERMLKISGRRVDVSSPFVDARLPDGSRLHVVIPDITAEHWAVNVRKFVVKATHLDDLVGLGTLTATAARFLDACVVAGLNVLDSLVRLREGRRWTGTAGLGSRSRGRAVGSGRRISRRRGCARRSR